MKTIPLFGRDFVLDDKDSLELEKYGEYEPLERSLIGNAINRNSICLDIGAHIGYFSVLMGQVAKKVIAFEPNPENYGVLRQNLKGLPNVSAYQWAVGDHAGEATLYLSEINSGDHRTQPDKWEERKTIKVQQTTIDLVVHEPVDFIKMDIQGGEGKALQGMVNTLKNSPRVKIAMEYWMSELHAAGTEPEEVLDFLRNMGFKIARIDEETKSLIWDNPTNGVSIEQGGYCNLWCER